MKKRLYRLFFSSVKLRVTGKNINNFIKRLIRNKINIIKVIPISYKEIDIIVNYNDLDKIMKIRSIYDIRIIKYYGFIKLLKKLKKNIYLLIALLFGFLVIYVLSNVIFSIEVIHSSSKIISLVEEELYNHGIKKYSFVKSYDEIEKIEDDILESNKDSLEWMEIIREGTKYIVRVEERLINKPKNDVNNYDIVAGKNAVIKSITAISGEKVKNIDTYVRKGEMIISGNVTLPSNEKVQGSANGTVIGEVWYNVDVDFPYYYHEVKYTGRKKKVLVLNFINKRISFFDFKKYKSFEKDVKYIFKDNINLLNLTYEYQYETNIIERNYNKEEAKKEAIEFAKKKLLEKYNKVNEITKVIVINESNLKSKIKLSLFVTCNEDITKYEIVKVQE